MNVNKNSFKDLSDLEMRKISGGGDSIFYKLGQAGHKAWCYVKDAWADFRATPSSGHGGVAGIGNHGATN
jgi:hypothetical protein